MLKIKFFQIFLVCIPETKCKKEEVKKLGVSIWVLSYTFFSFTAQKNLGFLQFPADLVTFTKENLDRKLHFLCNVIYINLVQVRMVYKLSSFIRWR